MPITRQTLDFLFENHLKNDREWFRQHRDTYKTTVEEPLLELAGQLAPTMQDIDGLMTTEPRRCLSRIWLDMRINRSGQYFRDHLWLAFRRGKGMVYPSYYFEVSPRGYGYGVGYYMMPAPVLETVRGWVQKGDRRFLAAQKALGGLPQFHLSGEEYKRKKFPGAPEALQPWLNRKCLSVNCEGADPELLFGHDLAERLAVAFRQLAPIYQFFLEAHLTAEG